MRNTDITHLGGKEGIHHIPQSPEKEKAWWPQSKHLPCATRPVLSLPILAFFFRFVLFPELHCSVPAIVPDGMVFARV